MVGVMRVVVRVMFRLVVRVRIRVMVRVVVRVIMFRVLVRMKVIVRVCVSGFNYGLRISCLFMFVNCLWFLMFVCLFYMCFYGL